MQARFCTQNEFLHFVYLVELILLGEMYTHIYIREKRVKCTRVCVCACAYHPLLPDRSVHPNANLIYIESRFGGQLHYNWN